jgi:hypothetical protein
MTAAIADPASTLRLRRLLGYAGLLPFVGCLAVMLLAGRQGWQDEAAIQLLYYAALIASFLGAIHWGAALRGEPQLQTARLVWGVTPALMAWSLLSLPPSIAFTGLAALFAFVLLVDCYLLPLLAADYRRLRLRLSTLVIGCLLTAALIHPGVGA